MVDEAAWSVIRWVYHPGGSLHLKVYIRSQVSLGGQDIVIHGDPDTVSAAAITVDADSLYWPIRDSNEATSATNSWAIPQTPSTLNEADLHLQVYGGDSGWMSEDFVVPGTTNVARDVSAETGVIITSRTGPLPSLDYAAAMGSNNDGASMRVGVALGGEQW